MEAVKARLARGYSRSAPSYDALAGHLYLAGIRRQLPRVRVPPYPAILDVGCGTGLNLVEAARWFAPTRLLCGIDLSPGMVEVARSKAGALGIPAQFAVGDAERLPYADGTFDLVICNSVFHWFKNRAAAMSEMKRVLRPGGQLVLICASARCFQEFFAVLDEVLPFVTGKAGGPSMPDLPTGAHVAGVMASCGLRIDYFANPVQPQRITDPEGFVAFMATVAPAWTADLPEETLGVLFQAVAALMRSRWPAGFPNTWSAVEAVATRWPR